MKRKVVFIIPTMDPGGIETYLIRFLEFSKDMIVPYVFVRNKSTGLLYERYRIITENIVFQPLGYVSAKKALKYYLLFKKINADTVVDFNGNFSGLTMWIGFLAGIKKRITFYRQSNNHFNENIFKRSYNIFVNKLVYKFSTHIFSNSQTAFDFFFHDIYNNDNRFKVISNGINLKNYRISISKDEIRRQLNLPADKFIIGHVGRLDPAKNHDIIIAVIQKLIYANIPVHMVLCGLNTEKLHNKLKDLGIIKHFTLLGFRKDVPLILKSFDLFFFPSITEGQPNALIEAMATGLNIVASNICAIKECVPNNLYPNLIAPDDMDAFANIIQYYTLFNSTNNIELSNYVRINYDSDKNFKTFLNFLF